MHAKAFPAHPIEFQHAVEIIDKSAAVGYVLDSDLRFAFCNPAWDKFALENGAPQLAQGRSLGSDYFAVIPPVLRPFYSDILEQVRRTALVWQHVYECSSPEQFRKFRMRTHLINCGWVLVTNTLVIERPHANPWHAESDVYKRDDGFITMCAHCRCSRRVNNPAQWDFVPAHVRDSPVRLRVSHGLCPVCRAYFYPAKSAHLPEP